jgi:septal ring factor EnvC (AmiA/AmiB activator)
VAFQDSAAAGDGRRLEQLHREIEAQQSEVDALYARWAELEEKIAAAASSRVSVETE